MDPTDKPRKLVERAQRRQRELAADAPQRHHGRHKRAEPAAEPAAELAAELDELDELAGLELPPPSAFAPTVAPSDEDEGDEL